ncbi:MAG: sensor histidine kinase [Acidimicrobiales bacterium]
MTAATEHGHRRHAVRVAIFTTVVVAVAYLLAAVIFDVVVLGRLSAQSDSRLATELHNVQNDPALAVSGGDNDAHISAAADHDEDRDEAPVFVWTLAADGHVVNATIGAPPLPVERWAMDTTYVDSTLAGSPFRLLSAPRTGGWFVAGVSLASEHHVRGLLLAAELIAGPVALVGMFAAALVIGLGAAAPVEQARRAQLEFTADASHELRTPVSVIAAEVELALAKTRSGSEERETLERIGAETTRMARIVEQLLWLARLDAEPPARREGDRADLGSIAAQCVDRFTPLAQARSQHMETDLSTEGRARVHAPAEWIDRLVGVLVDNACRYTPVGGTVRVRVEHRGHRVALVVEDSGPGIAPEERDDLFARFHRLTDEPGGTGLGLAIADSVVRSTGGRWHVGDSPLGGALMEVAWPRP